MGGQLWTNDEDLQAKPVDLNFTQGKVTVEAGTLVYGVRYLLSIYDIPDYQPFETNITAGIDSMKTVVVPRTSTDPLAVLTTNAASCRTATSSNDTSGSLLTFTFNQAIELATSTYPGGTAEQVDDNFTMTSPNANGDGGVNTLAADNSTTALEHGTSTIVSNDTITFAWSPSLGLGTKDPGDPITTSRWNLTGVSVQPVGRPADKRDLSTLSPVGATVTCN